MERKKKPSLTRQAWLNELGRRLVWSFPAAQVKDILSDYQEQFDAGHDHCKSEAEIIQALGTPAEAAALLLEEEPAARTNRLRQNILWGAALALCFVFLWLCLHTVSFGLFWIGSALFIPLASSVLFLLLRGTARVRLEREFPAGTASPVLSYCIPFILTLLTVGTEHILFLLARAGRLAAYDPVFIGETNTVFILAIEAILAVLGLWLLVRSVSRSIQYLPGVIHTVGAMGTAFFVYAHLHTPIAYRDESSIGLFLLLPCCLPYCAGLVTALAFQRWVDGRKPLPRIFQGSVVTWQDWRHRLGVSLLGWFSAEQTLEIMADYQEQYELGLEQGKDAEILLAEMGRPETVVRDLLAEDRKARLHRRKNWPWIVAAAVAGWLLVGLLRAFEFGSIGVPFVYHYHTCAIGIIALLLGTPSLFVLFHGRERAVVERRFPAPQTHPAWSYLPPLVFAAWVLGLSFWLIYCTFGLDEVPFFFGQPLSLYIILSIEFSTLLLTLLLIWTLARCSSNTIRYFPAVPCIAGSIATILCAGIYLSSMDIDYIGRSLPQSTQNFLPSIYPCLMGLLLAIVSWLVLRVTAKKEG